MGAKSPNSRCWQGWFLLEALREDPRSAFLLASDTGRQSLALLGLWMQHSGLCLGLHISFAKCLLCPALLS